MTAISRIMLSSIAAVATLVASNARAQGVRTSPDPEALAAYTQPHQLVDIGGRKLNLFCMGSGDSTVLFDAGASDWSVIWALVQSKVARRTRACAYDRAGLGYSEPAHGPRSPVAIVEDLHALIGAAGFEAPVILVGHSLGGFNVKLHAALYPNDVAGLVLVDPAEERPAERVREKMIARYGMAFTARTELADNDGLKQLLARYESCRTVAGAGDLDPATITYRRCSDPARPAFGPAIAAERKKLQVRQTYQEAQASEILNSIYGSTAGDSIYRNLFRKGVFGSMPLVVLSHGIYDAEDPADAADFKCGLWLHQETAALSRRGRQSVVPNTSHHIEIDAPDAIVDAVFNVLDASARPKR